MKRILGCLLLAIMLLPGMAMGAQEKPGAPEAITPGFSYHTLGTEADGLVRLQYNQVQVAGGLFILEDGYLSVAYEQEEDVLSPHPAGKPLTCLNSDLSVRWALTDQRLTGAWYTDLLELPGALVLGWERSRPPEGTVPSIVLIEKGTGVIRWQYEGPPTENGSMVWIGQCRADADGNILVGSNGDLRGNKSGSGTLSLLDAADGSVLWAVEYGTEYGMISISDICPLGGGWLLYGRREEDQIILYADARGVAQGYFTFRPWAEGYDSTWLRLMPVSQDAVYLGGWEMEGAVGPVEKPYHNRTLYLMRITEETFRNVPREGE